MGLVRFFARLGVLVLLLAVSLSAQATNRWDILNWCTSDQVAHRARCEGFIDAAVDLKTSDDFTAGKACFPPDTKLHQLRKPVVRWLKDNPVATEQSGLALVARALAETFPCNR